MSSDERVLGRGEGGALEPDEARVRAAASDPALRATERVLGAVKAGTTFRDAYRAESRAAERH